jgi:hypothetical protein
VIKYVGIPVSGDHRRAAAAFKPLSHGDADFDLAFMLIWLLAPLGVTLQDPGLAGWFVLYGLIVLANFWPRADRLLQIFDRYRAISAVMVGQSVLTLILVAVAYFYQGACWKCCWHTCWETVGSLFIHPRPGRGRKQWGLGWWRSPFGLLKEAARGRTVAVSTNISATINLVNKDGELLWSLR